MNDDSIATHMYWHVLSVLLTGQKKKKKKKTKKKKKKKKNKWFLCLIYDFVSCNYFKYVTSVDKTSVM